MAKTLDYIYLSSLHKLHFLIEKEQTAIRNLFLHLLLKFYRNYSYVPFHHDLQRCFHILELPFFSASLVRTCLKKKKRKKWYLWKIIYKLCLFQLSQILFLNIFHHQKAIYSNYITLPLLYKKAENNKEWLIWPLYILTDWTSFLQLYHTQ